MIWAGHERDSNHEKKVMPASMRPVQVFHRQPRHRFAVTVSCPTDQRARTEPWDGGLGAGLKVRQLPCKAGGGARLCLEGRRVFSKPSPTSTALCHIRRAFMLDLARRVGSCCQKKIQSSPAVYRSSPQTLPMFLI